MPYLKDLDVPGDQLVTVTLSAAEAARLMHGNAIYRALEAKAGLLAGKRVLTGDYTSAIDPETGDFVATFAMMPD